MKAVISNPLVVKAAANIATGGYCLSFFQVRRIGKLAQISGTNGYVVVIATVPATFTNWGEGKSILLSGEETRSMMRGIGISVKNAQQVSFVKTEQQVTVSSVSEGTTVSASFALDPLKFPHSAEGFKSGYEWGECLGRIGGTGEAKTETTIDPYMIATACNAIRALAIKRTYSMSLHGEHGAIELSMKDDDCMVQAIVMPVKAVA